ncbi:hypothetical protein L618_002800000170 [Rhodococcus rhodochrous J45]|uniref:Uncharacterized protein n=2 Tax=Nocardiaceae TaxID=85025 RepID=A0A562E2Q8_RHORH|nr:hypothetical protein L618_002800000170 [Rhodococcus rhodochrous J45]
MFGQLVRIAVGDETGHVDDAGRRGRIDRVPHLVSGREIDLPEIRRTHPVHEMDHDVHIVERGGKRVPVRDVHLGGLDTVVPPEAPQKEGARATTPPGDNEVLRVHRILSWPGTGVVIVRPDGYVGFRGSDSRRAEAWLEMIGVDRASRAQ